MPLAGKPRQAVVDFAFDGWGRKAPHSLDGAGTLMACESSVVSPGRNRGLAKEYVERRLRQCLGVSNFI